MQSYRNIHENRTGNASDKWDLYLDVYHNELHVFQDKKINLLEIGVQNGGSLEVWSKYFQKAKRIIGCDINEDCRKLSYSDKRIEVLIGDATNNDFCEKNFSSLSLDVIIDDGAHTSESVIKAFCLFFDRLKYGGKYIIEDLHCSYWQNYQGGLKYPYSSMSFLKKLADIVNHEHWNNNQESNALLTDYFKEYKVFIPEKQLTEIASVKFINSMCVIEKKSSEKNEIGKRNVTGTVAKVADTILNYRGSNIDKKNQIENPWSNFIENPEIEYFSLKKEKIDDQKRIDILNKQIEELEERTSNKREKILVLESRTQILKQQQQKLTLELDENVKQNKHLLNELHDAKAHIDSLKHELTSKQQALLQAQNRENEQNETINKLNNTIQQNLLELNEKTKTIQKYEEQYMELKQKLQNKEQQIHAERKRLQQELKHTNNTLNRLMANERNKLVRQYHRRLPLRLAGNLWRFIKNPLQYYRMRRDTLVVRRSGLFDDGWYLQQYPDLYLTTVDMLQHYMLYGAAEGRNPNSMFDAQYYLNNNPDVKEAGVNPLLHYVLYGEDEGRKPNQNFDPKFYLDANPDVKKVGISPFLHYVLYGKNEDRKTLKKDCKEEISKKNDLKFCAEKYTYEDKYIIDNNLSPEIRSEIEDIRKSNLFDEKYYKRQNEDIKNLDVDPILHYCISGWKEERNPSPTYDFNAYKNFYSDVKRENINPLLHYIRYGINEERQLIHNSHGFDSRIYINKNRNKVSTYRGGALRKRKNRVVVFTYLSSDVNPNCFSKFHICDQWDYVCFHNVDVDIDLDPVWEKRISECYNEDDDYVMQFYKTHQYFYFNDYDYCIWIDKTIVFNKKIVNAVKGFIKTEQEIAVLAKKDEAFFDVAEIKNTLLQDLGKLEYEIFFSNTSVLVYKNNSKKLNRGLNYYWSFYSKHRFRIAGINDIILSTDISYLLNKQSDIESLKYDINTRVKTKKNENEIFIPTYKLDLENIIRHIPKVSVDVIIPVFNALDDVKKCLNSIDSNLTYGINVVVADDSSSEQTIDWLKDYSSKKSYLDVLYTKNNLGYTQNVNRAIEKSNADFKVILNSDTIVSKYWIEKLIYCAYSDKNIGIVGPLSNAASWQTVPDIQKINNFPLYYGINEINNILENNCCRIYPKSELINGFCICVKKEVFHKIGLFNSVLFPKGYGEEDDFCLRANNAGFKTVIAIHTYIYHAKSKSFGHKKRIKNATISRKVLDEKYGKENLLNITASLRNNPYLNYYRRIISKLYESPEVVTSKIGEKINLITDYIYIKPEKFSLCVHLHLFYFEYAQYFFRHLNNIPFKFSLFISTCDDEKISEIESIFCDLNNIDNCVVKVVPNRGRDFAPMVVTFGHDILKYDYFLHIHSKKSLHDRQKGREWLDWMMEGMLHNNNYVNNIFSFFNKNDNVGLICAPVMESVYQHFKWGKNKNKTEDLLLKIGAKISLKENELYFPAGSFFWARTQSLKNLLSSNLTYNDFEEEPIEIDGALAHAIERSLCLIGKSNGFDYRVCFPDDSNIEEKNYQIIKERYIDYKTVGERIKKAIYEKQPYALIRYYDGEGAFYNIHKRDISYMNERMKYYFGDIEVDQESIKQIRDKIVESIDFADIIGMVPFSILNSIKEFIKENVGEDIDNLPYIRKRFNNIIDCDGAWRIFSAYKLVENAVQSPSLYCTKDVHYELVQSGLIYEILNQLEEVSIITSHVLLSEAIEKLFDIKVNNYLIPGRSFDKNESVNTNHYPLIFNQIMDRLNFDLRGQVFLIGAGPLGKVYCAKIKAQGGIAVDVGAIMDSWLNFHTRPEQSINMNSIAFDNRLLLSKENILKLTNGKVVCKNNYIPPLQKVNNKVLSRICNA